MFIRSHMLVYHVTFDLTSQQGVRASKAPPNWVPWQSSSERLLHACIRAVHDLLDCVTGQQRCVEHDGSCLPHGDI